MQREIMLINRGFSDINPLMTGVEDCQPGHSFGPFAREYYMIHYVVSGVGTFSTGGTTYPVKAGEMFLFSPREITTYCADSEHPWTYIWIGFTSSLPLNRIFNQHVISARECGPVFEDILKCEKFDRCREWYVCGKIFEILTYLDKKSSRQEETINEYALMAQNYIESNYQKPLSVQMMAKMLNLDRSYFTMVFKKQVGKSPQQYLIDYRLTKAAQNMIIYDYSPTEAAINCGYPDVFNFSRMFKKKYGVSPQYYKRQVRSNQTKLKKG